jgi:Tfp pilus assembly protein PilN
MPKTTKPELQPQPPQMLSPRMETKKPKSHKRLWLLTGVLVLALIMIGATVLQASKSSRSTKTTTQAAQLPADQAQPWYLAHDTDYTLTADQAQPWYLAHDTDYTLTADQAQPWYLAHDTDYTLTGNP